MKKITALLAAGTLTLTLAACGGEEGTTETTTTAEAVTEETTTEETTTEEAPVNASAPTQEELETWAKNTVGLSSDQEFIEAATDEMAPTWAATITGVRLDGSNLYFTAQIDRQTEEETAESIERMYYNALTLTPPEWANQVDWIIVEDGTGVVVTQEKI